MTTLSEALQGILELGRKDLSNPKYDGYFETAKAALVSSKAAEAPGGQDELETIEFIRTVLEWERDYRRINNLAGGGPDWVNWGEDLLQASETCQDCGHLPCDCAPAAPSERADEPQLGKCTQSTFGHSGLHRKSWACGNGFVPVCPTCGSHLSSQEGK